MSENKEPPKIISYSEAYEYIKSVARELHKRLMDEGFRDLAPKKDKKPSPKKKS